MHVDSLHERLERIVEHAISSVERARAMVESASPWRVDENSWSTFLEQYPNLVAHRSELTEREKLVLVRLLAELLMRDLLNSEDAVLASVAVQQVIREKGNEKHSA